MYEEILEGRGGGEKKKNKSLHVFCDQANWSMYYKSKQNELRYPYICRQKGKYERSENIIMYESAGEKICGVNPWQLPCRRFALTLWAPVKVKANNCHAERMLHSDAGRRPVIRTEQMQGHVFFLFLFFFPIIEA